jgi:flagellar protein FliS
MNYSNPWKSYQEVATQTAPRGHLVLMLFDGAIRFLDRALTGFSKEDPAEFHQTINNNVIRAQDIINELNRSLNLEAGGELAVHLRRVYQYVDYRLTQSNLKKEASGINEAVKRLTVLREAWATMLSAQSAQPLEPGPALSELAPA